MQWTPCVLVPPILVMCRRMQIPARDSCCVLGDRGGSGTRSGTGAGRDLRMSLTHVLKGGSRLKSDHEILLNMGRTLPFCCCCIWWYWGKNANREGLSKNLLLLLFFLLWPSCTYSFWGLVMLVLLELWLGGLHCCSVLLVWKPSLQISQQTHFLLNIKQLWNMAPVDRNIFFPYLLVMLQESLSQSAGTLANAASLDSSFGFTCGSTLCIPLKGLVLLEVLVSCQRWGCTCVYPQSVCYWVSGTSIFLAGTECCVVEF